MQINKLIDHTVLKATATTADIEKLCQLLFCRQP